MDNTLVSGTSKAFQNEFGSLPEHIFLSPGRINIIGEHIDYNNGYVLPAAIDKYICFAVSELKEGENSVFYAVDMEDRYNVAHAQELQPLKDEHTWANYLLGVLNQLNIRGMKTRPVQIAFSSSIPIGAGISSSAALECGFAFALNEIFQLGLSKKDLALIGQKSEHTFAGVNCGIMDQFASVFGQKEKVIKLDCDTLDYEYFDAHLGENTLVLLDSCVKHTLLTSGYNQIRRQVEEGLEIIKQNNPNVENWRDVTHDMVENLRERLGESVYEKSIFVVDEISRVGEAADALQKGNFGKLGALLSATHHGLSRQYGVSCEELDFLVEEVLKMDGVLGARMMGGGFGGCSVNLIRKDKAEEVISNISNLYKKQFDIDLKVYPVNISEGTSKYTQHAEV